MLRRIWSVERMRNGFKREAGRAQSLRGEKVEMMYCRYGEEDQFGRVGTVGRWGRCLGCGFMRTQLLILSSVDMSESRERRSVVSLALFSYKLRKAFVFQRSGSILPIKRDAFRNDVVKQLDVVGRPK